MDRKTFRDDGLGFLFLATLLIVVLSMTLMVTPKAALAGDYSAKFNSKGELIRPEGWREWIYVGTPLTPNSLNKPEAPFPEFHSVYIDPKSYAVWKKTGKFREGTLIAKELTLVGSTKAVSGKGFFMGEFQGFEIAYKSKQRYPKEPSGWAYFTFGHQPEPYQATAPAQPTAACAACHVAAAADDMVFTQYYPVLRAAKGRKGK